MRVLYLFGCFGRLGRVAYFLSLVGLVVSFLCLAIMFPAFILMLLPFSYVAFCLLANRLRDAGIPAFFACLPFALIFGTILLYFTFGFLTMGPGGSGSGGAPGTVRFYRRVEKFGEEQLGWIVAGVYFIAGLPPGRRRQAVSAQPIESVVWLPAAPTGD